MPYEQFERTYIRQSAYKVSVAANSWQTRMHVSYWQSGKDTMVRVIAEGYNGTPYCTLFEGTEAELISLMKRPEARRRVLGEAAA